AGEPEAVAGMRRRRLIGEAGLVQRAKEPVAAAVPREHTPRPVAAVSGRSEAHDENARLRIAEARKRTRPVALAVIARRGHGRHPLAIRDATPAAPARDDAAGRAPRAAPRL